MSPGLADRRPHRKQVDIRPPAPATGHLPALDRIGQLEGSPMAAYVDPYARSAYHLDLLNAG